MSDTEINWRLQDVHDALLRTKDAYAIMQQSDFEDASENADYFQMTFYELVDALRAWYEASAHSQVKHQSALRITEIANVLNQLPDPLKLPFETEMELMVEGYTRNADSTQQ